MDRVISVLIVIFGGYWAYMGWFEYGFWVGTTPGPGFLPVFIGIATVILGAAGLFKNQPPAFKVTKKNFIPVLGALLMIGSITILGMMISILLFMVIWLLVVEKFSFKWASILGVSTTAVIYLIFELVLKVPFPTGLIGI